MNPFQYYDFKIEDIKSSVSHLSKKEQDHVISCIKYYLEYFKNKRNSERLTEDVILGMEHFVDGEVLNSYSPNLHSEFCPKIELTPIVRHWLVKCLENDKTYVYAYNLLIQYVNCTIRIGFYELMNVPTIELYRDCKLNSV